MKKCSCCGLEKNETDFFKKRKNSLEGFCKECKKEKLKKTKEKNPEKYREKERLRSQKRRQTKEWKEWRKDYQFRNREKISKKAIEEYHKKNGLQQQKKWKERNKGKIRQYLIKSRKKYPYKVAARKYVSIALNSGILTRPHVCSKCFKECKTEAHHEDYLKPLEIIWLCRSCHGKEHRKYD